MVLLNDKLLFKTLDILRGKSKLPQEYSDLVKFLEIIYGVKAIDFILETMPGPKCRYKFRLQVILSSNDDYEKMRTKDTINYDPEIQINIAKKYCELLNSQKWLDKYNPEEIFVCYCDFSSELRTNTIRLADKEAIPFILEKYAHSDIWKICSSFSYLYIFFINDVNIEQYSKDGTCERIKNDYFGYIKKYDEFNCYLDGYNIVFDSKENVDKNYAGNLYYYFK